jgi:hypothetical protein
MVRRKHLNVAGWADNRRSDMAGGCAFRLVRVVQAHCGGAVVKGLISESAAPFESLEDKSRAATARADLAL